MTSVEISVISNSQSKNLQERRWNIQCSFKSMAGALVKYRSFIKPLNRFWTFRCDVIVVLSFFGNHQFFLCTVHLDTLKNDAKWEQYHCYPSIYLTDKQSNLGY